MEYSDSSSLVQVIVSVSVPAELSMLYGFCLYLWLMGKTFSYPYGILWIPEVGIPEVGFGGSAGNPSDSWLATHSLVRSNF